jgi:glyoxylase-like metal-dependent hydrolase (beta-lactamase superfamily II)
MRASFLYLSSPNGLKGLRILFVNVFGVAHPADSGAGSSAWTLVDAGLPFSASHIRHWAEGEFGGPPAAIVLTHGHFDHVSAAKDLAGEWQVPIYAHPLEFPYLTGRESYPSPNLSVGGGLMTLLSPLYPRGPIDVGDRLLELPIEGDACPALPGWRVLHTPGHTPGHVSFFRPSDRLLPAGDAFCTTQPESFFEAALAQKTRAARTACLFHLGSRAGCSLDPAPGCKIGPDIVAPGHGQPLAGEEMSAKLARLGDEFAASSRRSAA